MVDKITKKQRSQNMSKVKGKDTKLELRVRKKVFGKGFRYRISNTLPGKPDLVFTSKKLVLFINGCFWHQHSCAKAALPDDNKSFWEKKLNGNKTRDLLNIKRLEEGGWKVVTFWECEIKSEEELDKAVNKLSDILTLL